MSEVTSNEGLARLFEDAIVAVTLVSAQSSAGLQNRDQCLSLSAPYPAQGTSGEANGS